MYTQFRNNFIPISLLEHIHIFAFPHAQTEPKDSHRFTAPMLRRFRHKLYHAITGFYEFSSKYSEFPCITLYYLKYSEYNINMFRLQNTEENVEKIE